MDKMGGEGMSTTRKARGNVKATPWDKKKGLKRKAQKTNKNVQVAR